MVKVALLCQCYTIITVSCRESFQYPASSGGGTLVTLICVYLSVAERHFPSHLKKERDLKVTLCISPFQKLTITRIILLNALLCNGNPSFLP